MDFKKLYINLDLLRIPISLSYKDQYLYKTFVGSTLTIVAFIIIFVYFVVKLKELISKSSFSIITNEFQSPKDTINFTNVPILFSLTDNDGNPLELNSKIFEFSVVFSNYVQHFDKNGNCNITHIEKEIEIERCDRINSSLDLSYFEKYNISSFKCIKPYQEIILDGIFGDINGYKSFKINLKKCNNLKNICYDNDYIENLISNSRLSIIYLGYKINFYNPNKKDVEKVICSRSVPLSSFFNKRVFLYMSLVKYNLYDNIFLNNKKESIYFLNRDTRIEYKPYHEISENDIFYNNVYAFFAFVYDGNVIEYTKRVQKFGEIISYVGNLFNIILTLFRIINNYYSNKILFIDIFNRFFFEKRFKNNSIHLNDSNLFDFSKRKINSLKLKNQTQEKSINSKLNFNYIFDDKIIENNNLNKLNNNINNSYNKTGGKSILNKTKSFEIDKKLFSKELKLYYICPLFIIKNKKNLNFLFPIKYNVCNTFSLENFIEFLKMKKNIKRMQNEHIEKMRHKNRDNFTDNNIREEINKIFYYK